MLDQGWERRIIGFAERYEGSVGPMREITAVHPGRKAASFVELGWLAGCYFDGRVGGVGLGRVCADSGYRL